MTFNEWLGTPEASKLTDEQLPRAAWLAGAAVGGRASLMAVYGSERAVIAGQIAAALVTETAGQDQQPFVAREAVALADAVIAELVRTTTK